jgi:hypothetical protein
MSKVLRTFALGIGLLALFVLAGAQFLPDDLAQDAKWEDFLKTAEIVERQQMGGSEAVTNPWKLTLEKDGVKRNGLWKDIENRATRYPDSWKWEIAAYKIDRLIGLNMVPVTVERRLDEKRGSLSLWVESEMSLKKKTDENIKMPSYKVFYWNRATFLERAFDNLIANEDRHMNNILITKDWRMYLIDHSRSFRSSGKFLKELIYRKGGKEGDKFMSELPRPFVEKLKALTDADIRAAVGEYLTDDEIAAVLVRRDLILKEVDRLVKLNGEDKVLYDPGK